MKASKKIITNLILVFLLIIFMPSVILAASDPLNIEIVADHRDDGYVVFEFLSNGQKKTLKEIAEAQGEGSSRYTSLTITGYGNGSGFKIDFNDGEIKVITNSIGATINDDNITVLGAGIEYNATLDYENEQGENEDVELDEFTPNTGSTDDETFFKSLEKFLAWFVRALANGLNYLVQMSLQALGGSSGNVDIDQILFNNYPDTNASFFSKSIVPGPSSRLVEMFREAVSKWFNVFTAIAAAGYLAILLYIGVRILLRVGGEKQGKYKEALTYWVAGLLILFFFPNAIKFAIDINNSIVELIEESKSSVLGIGNTNASIDLSGFSVPVAADMEEYRNSISAKIDENPYSGGNSYMAEMATRAHESERLADAVVYLVMVWQFIMIVIMYYKRIFSIAFLIAIFPFVALSYAFDKIGDGSAQGFNTWTKEIMTNIFVQSIHALVYVFVIGAAYEGGSYSGDWLLMIMGISFLFKGEQILKKIIGLDADTTMKSLADTATRTIATVAIGRKVASSVADNVVGSHSHLGRTVQYYRQWRSEAKTVKNFDKLVTKPIVPSATNVSAFNPDLATDSNYMEVANAVQVLNNKDNVDAETVAKALDTVLKNRNSKDPNIQALINDGLNMTQEQLDEFARAQQLLVNSVIDGYTTDRDKYSKLKTKVDHDLDIHLEAIFPGDRERRLSLKRAMYYRLRDGDPEGKHKERSTSRVAVKQEIEKAEERRNNYWNPVILKQNGVQNPFSNNFKEEKLSSSAESTKNSILSTHYSAVGGSYTHENRTMAENLAILKDMSNQGNRVGGSGNKYTPTQAWRAVSYVTKHTNDSKENKRAVRAVLDRTKPEEIRAIYAEELSRQYIKTKGDPKKFRDVLSSKIEFNYKPEGATTEIEKENANTQFTRTMYDVISYIKENDKKAGERLCYDETLDEVSVKDILRKERIGAVDEKFDEAYVDYIVAERKEQNAEEISIIENFAREQLDDLPEEAAITYNGLSKQEHEQYSKELRSKFVEELARTGATTTGVVLGGAIGTGLAIGIGDDAPAAKEALVGASAGIMIGDTLAEKAFGNEEKTKTVKIINPYTGKAEDVKLQEEGILGSKFRLDQIKPNEVLRMDDNRLIGFQYNIKRQFLESKQRQTKEEELARRKSLFNDALGNKK